MKKSLNHLLLLSAFMLIIMLLSAGKSNLSAQAKQEYYELRVYHLDLGAGQEGKVDAFLKDVYIPALHRAGIAKVGVFKPIETDVLFGKRIFVFIPVKTTDQYVSLQEVLSKDKLYTEAARSFIDAPFNEPPYARCERIMLKAFRNMPQPFFPSYTNPVSERVYELRSYESATEAKAAKKIQMFNEGGEIDIFTSLKFNAVFYAEVISGSAMPNLMYMTTFSDMVSHDDHWKAFGATPEWKKLSAMEEYKNTVSNINKNLLRPTNYSDF
ncbi:MAG TPA: NIPSNAP family protein [Bacteroidales bacterium]|nr:NIPSNAP family protein [Bacteroidales bacterium]